jgi:hypothetical protein
MLLMHKLGKLGMRLIENLEVTTAIATTADQCLIEVFTGPVNEEYFATFRDIFPAARALFDARLMAVVSHVNNAGSVC